MRNLTATFSEKKHSGIDHKFQKIRIYCRIGTGRVVIVDGVGYVSMEWNEYNPFSSAYQWYEEIGTIITFN